MRFPSEDIMIEKLKTWIDEQNGEDEFRQAIRDVLFSIKDLQKKRVLEPDVLDEIFTI
jgi:hypothetical protein